MPETPYIIKFSLQMYKLFLRAYPVKFREKYGTHMTQVFRDCCLQTFNERNIKGIVVLWMATFLDFFQSVISEHLQKEIQMKVEMNIEDIRSAGLALMLGGVGFSFIFLNLLLNIQSLWFLNLFLMALFCIPLIAAGLAGLSKRYGEKVGGFGKNVLLFGAVLGPIVAILGPIIVMVWNGTGPMSDEAENVIEGLIASMAFLLGPGTLFVSLTLFGIVAIYKKPLPRWNFIPMIAGGLSPFFFFVIPQIILALNEAVFISIAERYWNIFYFAGILQGIALMALGYVLLKDVPEDVVAPT
ncbi:MAG: hypothetical protein JNM46_08730 [Anaerolineales bacterium]|nr:hypothetical protein [Anaerolineales bacterium]